MILAVLLDGAEPQRVAPGGNGAEQEVERLTIDGVLHRVGHGGNAREVVVLHRLRAAEGLLVLIGAAVDADGAAVRQVHERSREVVLALAIPAPQAADHGRVHARIGNVAPVLVGEARGVLLAVAEVGPQRPGDEQHAQNTAADDEGQRLHAVAVGLVGPVLLIGQHLVESHLVRMELRRIGREVREPRHGEHHARLGVLAGVHLRHRVRDAAVRVDGQRPVKRAMAPRAHVLAGLHRHALRHRQRQRHGDVGGRFLPLVAHVLPVHFGHVLVGLHAVHHGVVQLDDRLLIRDVEEGVHRVHRRIDRIRIRSRAARIAPAQHERHAGQRLPLAHHVAVPVHARHAHGVHLQLRVRRQPLERPPHRREVTVEVERALLHRMQRPVRLGLRRYVDLRHVVGLRERLARRGGQQRDGGQDERGRQQCETRRNRTAHGPGVGNGGAHRTCRGGCCSGV